MNPTRREEGHDLVATMVGGVKAPGQPARVDIAVCEPRTWRRVAVLRGLDLATAERVRGEFVERDVP